ncbi:MAG: hypothetical protein Q9221_008684 [Calogaya cf. arnoldii]
MAAQPSSSDPAESSPSRTSRLFKGLLLIVTRDKFATVMWGIVDLFRGTENVWAEEPPKFFEEYFDDAIKSRKQFLLKLVTWMKDLRAKDAEGDKWRETIQATANLYHPMAADLLEEAEKEEEEEKAKGTDVKGKGKAS